MSNSKRSYCNGRYTIWGTAIRRINGDFSPILRADFKIVETYIHDKIHNHVILIFLYLMGKMMNLLHMISNKMGTIHK